MTILSVDPNVPVDYMRRKHPSYAGFDHIAWYVGNSLQAASYFVTRFGFKVIAHRGPETGSPLLSSYVVANGRAQLVFTAPVAGPDRKDHRASEHDHRLLKEAHAHLAKHGDGVKDIAFEVDDVCGIWEHAVTNDANAKSVAEPTVMGDVDADRGNALIATITTFGSTTHTLVNRSDYRGVFLPGYREVAGDDPINKLLPPIDCIEIDHCVGNQPWNGLDDIVR